jgi:chaperone modulatory protein CbpM
MTMDHREFLDRVRLEAEALEAWIAAGWLVLSHEDAKGQFTEADVARAELIHDLKRDLGVNDEGISVILDLIDQLHGMRRTLGGLLSAIQAQPDDVRQRLVVSAQQTIIRHHTGPAGRERASQARRGADPGSESQG